MSSSSSSEAAESGVTWSLPWLGAMSALGWLALLEFVAYSRAGVFEYPLDDVYIHLAMALNIAQGTYGINPGEPASAASSIIYPLLLAPFAGLRYGWLAPLVVNAVGAVLAGAMWGRIVSMAPAVARSAAILLALLGPLVLNIAGVAYTGMEHSLQTLASLSVVAGLWLWITTGRLAWWLAAAIIVGPLVRLENLGFSLVACGILMVSGSWRRGILLGLLCLLPVAAFAAFLHHLGLPVVPSSILVKMQEPAQSGGLFERLAGRLNHNMLETSGKVLFWLAVLGLGLSLMPPRRRFASLLLLGITVTAFAQLLLGGVGWMNRYETHVLIALVGALLLARPKLGGMTVTGPLVVLVAMAALPVYVLPMWFGYLWNTRAIHVQQGQMARFHDEYLPVPVAVNDIGLVAYKSPTYVLDLWGLASDRARRIRLESNPAPGWAGPLAAEKGVRLAMIYNLWLRRAVPDDWVELARLKYVGTWGLLGDKVVSFYATTPDAVEPTMRALDAFAPTVPEGAELERLPPGGN